MNLRWLLALLAASLSALADDTPQPPQTWAQGPGFSGNWLGQRSSLADKGISPYATWSGEFFRNFKGGLRTGTDWDGMLEFGLDIDLAKAAGLHGASIHISGQWIQDDDDPSANLVGNFDEVSNISGNEAVRFFQAYFKQQLAGGAFTYKFGQLALDDDFMTSTGASLFLNASFGPLPIQSANILAPIYPLGALGAWTQWQPNQKFSIQSGIYDGDTGTELSNRNGLNPGGPSGGVALLIEASLATTLLHHHGTFKLGGYLHTGDFTDYTTGTAVSNNSALYAILDQTLIGKADNSRLAAFLRAGFCPSSDRNEVDWYFDLGLNAQGFRPNDRFGLAFAHAHFSDAFATAQSSAGSPITTSESVIELTYLFQVTPWFTLQPDLQYVIDPQNALASNAIVAGLRAKLTF